MRKVESTETKTFLEKEELQKIQELNSEFTGMKIKLGEIELNKQNILNECNRIKASFAAQEMLLIDKYGVDCTINLQTGEVTQKSPAQPTE